MLNVHLIYKPPSFWGVLFRSGGYPSRFSCLKRFRALVVPSRGLRKGVIIQGILTPTGVLPNVQSCLRIKGDVTGSSVHSPIQRNSTYIQTVRRSVYETRWPEHPHLPIRQYKRRPLGPASRPCYTPTLILSTFLRFLLPSSMIISDPLSGWEVSETPGTIGNWRNPWNIREGHGSIIWRCF